MLMPACGNGTADSPVHPPGARCSGLALTVVLRAGWCHGSELEDCPCASVAHYRSFKRVPVASWFPALRNSALAQLPSANLRGCEV